MSNDIFIQAANKVMFSHRTPDPKDVCNLCDKEVGKDNLITSKNANICFDCSDLAKEIADKERERLSKREIKRIAAIISDDEIDMGMVKAYPYAERLYKAGYRKVE